MGRVLVLILLSLFILAVLICTGIIEVPFISNLFSKQLSVFDILPDDVGKATQVIFIQINNPKQIYETTQALSEKVATSLNTSVNKSKIEAFVNLEHINRIIGVLIYNGSLLTSSVVSFTPITHGYPSYCDSVKFSAVIYLDSPQPIKYCEGNYTISSREACKLDVDKIGSLSTVKSLFNCDIYLVKYTDTTLVVGDPETVKKAIDILDGKKKSYSDDLVEKLKDMSKNLLTKNVFFGAILKKEDEHLLTSLGMDINNFIIDGKLLMFCNNKTRLNEVYLELGRASYFLPEKIGSLDVEKPSEDRLEASFNVNLDNVVDALILWYTAGLQNKPPTSSRDKDASVRVLYSSRFV